MKIQQGDICPLIKIKSPFGIDFYKEHMKVIEENGYVWFCRFGKNNMLRDVLLQYAPYLIIKESGIKNGGLYIARYTEIVEDEPRDNQTPQYYESIKQYPSLWFKLTKIKSLDYSMLASKFVGKSSGGQVEGILRSICPAFYIKSVSNLNL
ncbi:MAG: hypothetical protein ACTTH3_05355 [Schwartzia sp. (in: firmicutes)]